MFLIKLEIFVFNASFIEDKNQKFNFHKVKIQNSEEWIYCYDFSTGIEEGSTSFQRFFFSMQIFIFNGSFNEEKKQKFKIRKSEFIATIFSPELKKKILRSYYSSSRNWRKWYSTVFVFKFCNSLGIFTVDRKCMSLKIFFLLQL